jgi:outer membrane protein insertion porin family
MRHDVPSGNILQLNLPGPDAVVRPMDGGGVRFCGGVADNLPRAIRMPLRNKALRGAATAGAALVAMLSLPAAPAAAQQEVPEAGERPLIERLTFNGVAALDEADLRASIVAQETRCRSFVLRPFCALTSWSVLLDQHYLDREELPRDELRLRVYYFQRGYRSAQVASSVRPRGSGVEVVFEVEEGPPTLIEAWSLRQTTDVLSSRRIRRADLPGEGDPLDLMRLSLGLADLASAYGQAGHLDAELRDSIAVSADELSARVAIEMDVGPRATLDSVVVSGNDRIAAGSIEEALRLRRGRVLRTNDVAAGQRSLYESNLFHEARVRVPEQQDSAKRVEIRVREAPPRGAQVGAGFNTAEFVQVEGRFTHYDWLGGSRRLDLRATVGNLFANQLNGNFGFGNVLPEGGAAFVDSDRFLRPTWQVSAEFRQPTFLSAANVLSLSAFAHRRTIPGIAVDDGYGGGFSVTRRLDFPTPITASYRFEMSAVRAGDLYFCVNFGICELSSVEALRGRNAMSPVSLSYVDNRADDPIAPTTGYRLRAEVEHASQLTFSDFRYNRLSAAGAYYLPLDLHRRRVLAGRIRVGWVRPQSGTAEAIGVDDEADRILHPRKRFYAGGSRSVRGYQENQLGPRVLTVDPAALLSEEGGCAQAEIVDGTCDPSRLPSSEFQPQPVGGQTLLEANIEYRIPLREALQGAVFIDGALVGDGIRDMFRVGAGAITPGFGVRWHSPVGPVRVDLGVRPGVVEDLPVVTEVTDADGTRRLVRLDTRKRYDPLEDAKGFLGQALGRLVLHLSIGEAF